MTPKPASLDDAGRFQLLLEAVVDYAIYMLDPDGYVASWNPGGERIKGYTSAEIIGKHFSIFFTPEDREAGRPALALETARLTGRFEDENWRIRKDGSRFWALAVLDAVRDAKGTVIGFAKITRDMTERKQAQDKLRRSEEQFRLMVQGVTDYAICMLDPEGRVANWNAGARRIKGYEADEIVGQHFSRFYTEEARRNGEPQRMLDQALRNGRSEREALRVRKDGTTFWAHVVIDPIRDDGGTLIGFAKVTRDITERKRTQEALDRTREQLFQAQKMETVGRLTGGVAHDFNNLLTAVIASLDLIARFSPGDERIRRLVDTAQKAAGRGAQLTGQLLAFSRQQMLRPQTANLNDLIEAFEALLQRACPETVAFTLQLDRDLGNAEVDPAQFQSAILNLVINAKDAMPQGGRLTIRTRNVEIDAKRAEELQEIAPGRYVMAEVADTGTGMSPQVRSRAVEPFFTTKDIGKGTGLGLSQVYGFVRQSGGQIEIESSPGKGTAIRLYLPRTDIASEESGSEPIANETGLSGCILLVEDDPDVRAVSSETLRMLGFTVYQASGGAEALAMLQAGARVDVLFSDVIMPNGMNGVELARAARRSSPDLKILLASGYPREVLVRQGQGSEEFAFLHKPYTLTALIDALKVL